MRAANTLSKSLPASSKKQMSRYVDGESAGLPLEEDHLDYFPSGGKSPGLQTTVKDSQDTANFSTLTPSSTDAGVRLRREKRLILPHYEKEGVDYVPHQLGVKILDK